MLTVGDRSPGDPDAARAGCLKIIMNPVVHLGSGRLFSQRLVRCAP
jgi:hypothetical protein